jgi:hypothetical protein
MCVTTFTLPSVIIIIIIIIIIITLAQCAPIRKVAGSIPDGVIGIFIEKVVQAALWPWG